MHIIFWISMLLLAIAVLRCARFLWRLLPGPIQIIAAGSAVSFFVIWTLIQVSQPAPAASTRPDLDKYASRTMAWYHATDSHGRSAYANAAMARLHEADPKTSVISARQLKQCLDATSAKETDSVGLSTIAAFCVNLWMTGH